MKETISAYLQGVCQEKNLDNITERTINDTAESYATLITSEDMFTDQYKEILSKSLSIVNGQSYHDKKVSYEKGKSEATPAPVLKVEPPVDPKPEPPKPNEDVEALKKQVKEMADKEAKREAKVAEENLINGIKNKYRDEASKSRFATFVDNARIDMSADVDTNYETLSKAFKKIGVDSTNLTRQPDGVPSGFKQDKYDRYFKKSKK